MSAVQVAVTGDLDTYAGPVLVQRVLDLLDDDISAIRLDLSNVTFMDSAGLYSLEQCRRAAGERSVRLTLVEPAEAVQTLLDMTGFGQILEIEPPD